VLKNAVTKQIVFIIVICGVLTTMVTASWAQLVLYDNFSGARVNPEKWRGTEGSNPSGNPNTEAVRTLASGQLRLFLDSYGETFATTGTQTGRFGLEVREPGPVTAMQASVTIRAAIAQDCPANSAANRARAQLVGWFFNDGTGSGLGDATGDIRAGISMIRDSKNGDRISVFIDRCTDSGCTSTATVASEVLTTIWTLNQPHTLQMVWNPAQNRFRFRVTPNAGAAEAVDLSYAGVADTTLPRRIDDKRLEVSNTAANCTSGRTESLMDARFDNVRLNTEAVP
jgi:hypothetical protein